MRSFDEFIELSQLAKSAAELADLFFETVAEDGYENAVFAQVERGIVTGIPFSRLPEGYAETYQHERWDRIDPVLERVRSARTSFFWDDVTPAKSLTREQVGFLTECSRFGVQSGITVPIHGPGHRINLVSLSRKQADRNDHRTLSRLTAITMQMWSRYQELFEPKRATEPEADTERLTPREIDVLYWTKQGKTYWEIGEILKISEKTVEYHIGNIFKKFQTSNKIVAVVKAMQRGYLSL